MNIVLALLLSSALFADQLAWITREQAEEAARHIRPGDVVVLFCSRADQETIRFLTIDDVSIVAQRDGFHSVHVSGTIVKESEAAYDQGVGYTVDATYVARNDKFKGDLDLAYVYVERGGTYKVLGKVLNYACDVTVHEIR